MVDAKLRVTQVRSVIGKPPDQRRTVRALGLKRIRDVAEHPDRPEIRGMIRKVSHLVEVEELSSSASGRAPDEELSSSASGRAPDKEVS